MQAPESAEEESRIAEQAVGEKRRIIENLFNPDDPSAARDFAEAELANTRSLKRNDPKRGDALALQLHLMQIEEKFHDAVPVAAEIIRIRKAAKPTDYARVALALSSYAVALFGAEQPAASDKAIEDSRKAWHKAYAQDDIRLAQRLKTQADFVGSVNGFNRPRQAIALLVDAVDVRRKAKNGLREALADALESLGLLEKRIGDFAKADVHLAEAAKLLSEEAEHQTIKQRSDELRAGLVQILIVRAEIAMELGGFSDADALIKRAQAEPMEGPDALEQSFLLSAIESNVLERQGKADGALEEDFKQLALAHQMVPPDAGLVGDIKERIGDRFRNKNEFEKAKTYFQEALALRGGEGPETASIMLKLADINDRQGHAIDAEVLYRRGLEFRKGTISEVSVLFGTNRAPMPGWDGVFGTDMASSTAFGEALVLVPGGPGSADAVIEPSHPLPATFGPATSAERLITLQPATLDQRAFADSVTQRTRNAVLYPDAALIFVHGYANEFQFALARLAQLVRNINFDGPAFAFSWPSQGSNALISYKADQVSARNSVTSLVSFIKTVAATSTAKKLHVVAHSMGNEILLRALIELNRPELADLSQRIGEVVFASPDVDQADFRRWIAALDQRSLTLYASRHDRALRISRLVNINSIRAGYVASGVPVVVPGVESIDVSEGGDDIFATNHSIYVDNPVVTDDLRKLFQKGVHPPSSRSGAMLETQHDKSGARYWYYRRPHVN
jgi:esterase/lipase superfamily enzyme/tetratricopeptide (TPR) repeat protein